MQRLVKQLTEGCALRETALADGTLKRLGACENQERAHQKNSKQARMSPIVGQGMAGVLLLHRASRTDRTRMFLVIPVCVYSCVLSTAFWVKALPHPSKGHTKAFSVPCVSMCVRRAPARVNV